MAVIPYIVAYLALAVFVVAVIARFLMWSKLPMHLRWELYPVPHEAPARAKYGGSYLEELNWWQKSREKNTPGELKAMIPEMVFMVALKEHNPKLWSRSFPFHFGIYMVITCTVVLFFTGVLGAIAPSAVAGGFGTLLRWAITFTGVGGMALGIIGALGLLHRRLSTPELRNFASPADIFNLLFFLAVFGLSLVTFALVDRNFAIATAFVSNLVRFNMVAWPGEGLTTLLPTLSFIGLALLVAYIPLTHMSHFVGKYFAYHAIRWSDAPNLQGGEQEATINALLQKPITWAGPHIQGDGKKTWAQAATEDIPQ